MSNYLALSGTSATLRTLLRDRMVNLVPVTIAPPDVAVRGTDGKRVNLYLYQVTENGFLSNQEVPGHGHPGAYGRPPLSLVLYYLMTGYGSNEAAADADLDAQQVLGDAMGVLHDFPIITPEMTITRPAAGVVGDPILDLSLLNEFEKIKVTLRHTGLEDFSKLWTALSQVNFRRSVTYEISVVQIESQLPRRASFPVKVRRLHMAIQQRPQITAVYRSPLTPLDPIGDPRVAVMQSITIEGVNFNAFKSWVRLGSLDPILVTPLSDGQIRVTVPDDLYPPDADHPQPPQPIPAERLLQPGPQLVAVIAQRATEVVQGGLDRGLVVRDRDSQVSNQGVFMLVPRIMGITANLAAVPRTLAIQGTRLFLDTLVGEALIGGALIPQSTYLPGRTPLLITVPLPDTLPAWPVRCLISGDLSVFPALTATPEVAVTIGAEGPRTATFAARPTVLADAPSILQAAIRGAPSAGPGFLNARVATLGSRLVVVPGGLGDPVTIANVPANQTADDLKLTAATGGISASAYLSGELVPFPAMTARMPAIQLMIAGVVHVVTLPTRPTTVAEVARMLEAAIRGAGPEAGFTGANVTTMGSQMLIVPGAAGNVTFDKVIGIDETTVVELQLRARYPVRVRVNGAESIDPVDVSLP